MPNRKSARNAQAAAVSVTLRGLRSISVTPRLASSAASWRLNGGCDRLSRAAARPKWRVSASVTK
jgi:hypothetical protein